MSTAEKYIIYIKEELKDSNDIYCKFISHILALFVMIFLIVLIVVFAFLIVNLFEHVFIIPEKRSKCKNPLLPNNIDCLIVESDLIFAMLKSVFFIVDTIMLIMYYRNCKYFNLKLNLSHIFLYVLLICICDINTFNKATIFLNIIIISTLFIPKNIENIKEKMSNIENDIEIQKLKTEHKKTDEIW